MSRWTDLCKRIFHLRRRSKFSREIAEEISHHVELKTEENKQAGMPPEEARYAAQREFGNVTLVNEDSRNAWAIRRLDETLQDLRYALRQMRRSPGYAAIAILTLALGIGANTAIFSVIDALMLRKLPVRNPEELVAFRVDDGNPKADAWYYVAHSYPGFQKLRPKTNVFSNISAIALLDRSGVRVNGKSEVDSSQVRVALVSGNYFEMMGVNTAIGRVITPQDDRIPDGEPVAVISDAYWKRRFEGSRDIVGRTLTLNGTTYTLLGVAPHAFTGDWVGRPVDVWIPIMMQSEVMVEMPGFLTRRNGWLRIIARLKPGVTMPQAQAAARVAWRQVQHDNAGPNATPEQLRHAETDQLYLVSAANGYSPQRAAFGQSLTILMVIVGLVFFVACSNVATLLLMRSSTRRREMALRLALGAGRARLIRQLLTEGILLAILGGVIGLLFSLWSTRALSSVSLAPVQLDSRGASSWVSLEFSPDLSVLAFIAALCILNSIFFALACAFRGSNVPLARALTGRGVEAGGRFGFGKSLVIAEVALSFILIVGAGLFVNTLRNLRSVELGVDRRHLLLVWTSPGQTGQSGPAIASLCRTVLQRISMLPGVLSVSASSRGFLMGGSAGGGASEDVRIPGQSPRPGQLLSVGAVTPAYFATVGLPLLAGRDFNELDTPDKPRVEIVNETFAHFFFGNQNPIGQHYGRYRDSGFPIEIVGVVKDTVYASPREKKTMWSYIPSTQSPGQLRDMQVEIKVDGNPRGIASQVQSEIQRVAPNLPVIKIDTVEEQLDDVLAPERLTAALAAVFGSLATFMACLGVYGVIAFTVARRTSEIGLRMALGAQRDAILGMILNDCLLLVALGIVSGIPTTLAATRLISSRLYGIGASDPMTIIGATLLMLVVGAVAGLLPAYRASRVDPMVALRCE